MKRAVSISAVALLPALACVSWAETPLVTNGDVDAVTVYRGQALITRVVDVPGPAGLHEVVVTELPENVAPGSLYAESADGVEIRSVRYRIQPVKEDVRDEVRRLDEKLQELRDQLDANGRRQELMEEKRSYINKLEAFTAGTANSELSQGVLNADTLTKLTDMIFNHRHTLAEDGLQLGLEARDLRNEIQQLERERQVLAGTSRTVREAVVFVEVPDQAGGQFRLRYLVNNATWSPYYNMRANAARDSVDVEYYASVRQTSGEDWNDVAMTLSTATPNLVARAPELDPMAVALSPVEEALAEGGKGYSLKGYDEALADLKRRRELTEEQRSHTSYAQMQQQAAEPRDSSIAVPGNQFDKDLNVVANEIQILDLVHQGRLGKGRPGGYAPTEGVSVTYRLASRTSLPSRADQQLIQIAAVPVSGDFYRVATPVLTSHVYEEAALVNDSQLVLLAGPIATYVDGEFVGNGELPTVAAGERFTIGLGIDPSLRIDRELLDKSDRVQGGNRIVTLSYRLAVENFGAEPVTVRLLDRLPESKKNELTVTFDPQHPNFCEDAHYVKTQRPKGILRWDIQVPAQATGPNAATVEYVYTLEYDKQLAISSLNPTT